MSAWTLDVLTLDYLVTGQVDPDAQKWAWAYFSTRFLQTAAFVAAGA
jgi:hypothetical protein